MVAKALSLLACLALHAAARPHRYQTPLKPADEEDGCPTGVHVVGVRGTLEDPGFGAMQPIVDKILADIPDSDSFAIDYPAGGITIGDDGKPIYQPLQYILSVQEGRSKLQAELVDFNLFCPNTSVVLLGYSQVSCSS
jgi:acetylxylan esterase